MSDKSNGEVIRKIVEGMDVLGFDPHMDEVMREYRNGSIEKMNTITADPESAGILFPDDAEQLAIKACRSYARKVVEEIKTKAKLFDPENKYTSYVPGLYLDVVLDRLTDKEPT